ncbi:MAG: hypothetical protein J6C66_06100 [Prevotella sp.]|nr:hypothetical protein [Prevotella sp.]
MPNYITRTPAIASTGVSVTADNVQIEFPALPNSNARFFGPIFVVIGQSIPTGAATTLPIVFTSRGGNTIPLVTRNNVPVTVATFPGTGAYWIAYNSATKTLQLM